MNILKALERKKGEMEEAMVWQEVVSSEDQLAGKVGSLGYGEEARKHLQLPKRGGR